MPQFAALFVAFIISAIVSQHQISIPQTKITFTAKKFIIFWAIIWLGVPSTVLLAAGFAPFDINSR
jgi:hypothetical protein